MALRADQGSRPTLRHDYAPPAWLVDQVDLTIALDRRCTTVTARLQVRRNPDSIDARAPLALYGAGLVTRRVSVDGRVLADHERRFEGESMIIGGVPDQAEVETEVEISPERNTALEGLYASGAMLLTQCEPEGFRKITWFPDRPDVMSRYRVRLEGDREQFPVLLSNGNCIERGRIDDARDYAVWDDPFPKPSYLFAIAAGRLATLSDRYTTASGRVVDLHILSEPDNLDRLDHAMASLKRSMRWDEERFGLEYDLDVYHIVATHDFNMGAMENKSLNIFNARYVLADQHTATDADFEAVEAVIAHEYFHNWTGNRVTCRDWFQLSLKEGLTVFRDQQFSADQGSRGVKRIEDVNILRSVQFPQDAGPMAHPVRPDAYIEINNFYTVTVYNKGAEVIRMLHQLLGKDGFRRGMDRYFERHDGQAVTCGDFVAAMEAANAVDLTLFRRWYQQAGTPELQISDDYDEQHRHYTLTVRQRTPATAGQPRKQPLHIPLALGLLDSTGHDLPLQLEGENAPADGGTRVLELHSEEQQFRFINLPERPIPSLLREFSAPVRVHYEYPDADLQFLLAHDSDDFNRWEAGQQLIIRNILGQVAERRSGHSPPASDALIGTLGKVLADPAIDPALCALILTLPSENYLAEQMTEVDVDGIHAVRTELRKTLASTLHDTLLDRYLTLSHPAVANPDSDAIGRRSLKNCCLGYLATDEAGIELALRQYRRAGNMTDQLAALKALVHGDGTERESVLGDFFNQWEHEPLVVDKWFTLQAATPRADVLARVQQLLTHRAFEIRNPNKVRALLGAFSQNPIGFHAADGSGYAFIAEQVLALDTLNPQVAARLLGAFTRWRKYDASRQEKMCRELKRILANDKLSPDVYEIAAKSLNG